MTEPDAARTVVVDLMRVGREWVAASPELGESPLWRDDLETLKQAVISELGTHVTPVWRDLGAPSA